MAMAWVIILLLLLMLMSEWVQGHPAEHTMRQ